MTGADLLLDLKAIIGPGCEADDTELMRWLNDAYLNVCDEISALVPDYFTKASTTDTVTSQQEYVLPSDFDKVIMVNIAYDGTNWYRALPVNNIGAVPVHASTTSTNGYSVSNPRYYIYGNNIGFLPIPSASGNENIKMWYTYNPTELSAGTTPSIPTKMQHVLKYGAYASYLDLDDEHVAAERMRNRFDTRVSRMVEQLSQREVDQPRSVQIVENQDLYLE